MRQARKAIQRSVGPSVQDNNEVEHDLSQEDLRRTRLVLVWFRLTFVRFVLALVKGFTSLTP